jgi:hypothetical protein
LFCKGIGDGIERLAKGLEYKHESLGSHAHAGGRMGRKEIDLAPSALFARCAKIAVVKVRTRAVYK